MEVLENVLKTEEYCGSAQMDAHISYSVCRHLWLTLLRHEAALQWIASGSLASSSILVSSWGKCPLRYHMDGTGRIMILLGTVCSSLSSLILKIRILAEGRRCWEHLHHGFRWLLASSYSAGACWQIWAVLSSRCIFSFSCCSSCL